MDPTAITIGGFGALALIIALVQIAVNAGLPSRFAPPAALVVGVVLAELNAVAGAPVPSRVDLIQPFLLGLGLGSAAVATHTVWLATKAQAERAATASRSADTTDAWMTTLTGIVTETAAALTKPPPAPLSSDAATAPPADTDAT